MLAESAGPRVYQELNKKRVSGCIAAVKNDLPLRL